MAMTRQPSHTAAGREHGPASLAELLDDLERLEQRLHDAERDAAPWLAAVHAAQRAGARNLVHFLALRQQDLRDTQERLTELGLSSLGRSESHVLASVQRVRQAVHALGGRPQPSGHGAAAEGVHAARAMLRRQCDAVFGQPPRGRDVRIIVTLPAEAADDEALLSRLVGAGMDVARINAAHGDAEAWTRMAAHARAAARRLGRPLRVMLDLPGPKLRTGALPDEPPVLRLKPERDAYGRVLAPARLWLRAPEALAADVDADVHAATDDDAHGVPALTVPAAWLAGLADGARVSLQDARGRDRRLRVRARHPGRALLETDRSTYIVATTALQAAGGSVVPAGLPCRPGRLLLAPGDRLELRHPDRAPGAGLSIPCTLPQVFTQVRAGDPIAFDDGRIAGVVRQASAEALDVEIVHTRAAREPLGADRGINLPGTTLDLPAPTAQDLAALDVAVRVADLVAMSFVQRAEDVAAMHDALRQRGATHLPVLLKIETRAGFENLPALMLAAMAAPATGVMIARGDLAVELGWQRLAEVQEEMLWAAEAAHLPVVWATQVLESLARQGLPSRAEITDAAMSVRAEAVMLNKGPHVVQAVEMLDDILRRMQAHQSKKRSLLRALHFLPGESPPPARE